MATGHYAQVDHQKEESILLRGADQNKDQTYFLCQIAPSALKRTLFPIGAMKKQEVREIADRLQLRSVAQKKDSTGICFIGERNFRQFLTNYIPMQDGDIVDIASLEVIGRHQGVYYYTIGQRKGLGIGAIGGPWFVIGKDVHKNILYVARGDDRSWLISTSCIVSDVNWFSSVKPSTTYACTAKFRYRQPDQEVTLRFIDDTTVLVSYAQGVAAVTDGQEAVFYQGERCLGGGVIQAVFDEGIPIAEKIAVRLQDGKAN